MFRCPKCGAQVNEYDITCGGCGSYFSPCIASGQSILTRGYTQCRRCKKKMILTEIKSISLRNCPLCHHKLQELEEMGPDD